MAVSSQTGGTGTVDTTGGQIFDVTSSSDPSDRVTSIQVWADDNNTNQLQVEVDGMHDSGEGCVLDPGKTAVFRLGDGHLSKVTVKASSGTETVHWGVVAKTSAGF